MRDAFAGNFEKHGEIGAAVAIAIDGRLIVDLWAGWADVARTLAWRRDTLVNVFSVGKGFTALPAVTDEELMIRNTYYNPPGLSGAGLVNTRRWREAEIPSTNGHATARAVARVYAALAAGGSLGFADPEAGVGFGYVMNKMGPRWQSPTPCSVDVSLTPS